jgi:hypothetical protein
VKFKKKINFNLYIDIYVFVYLFVCVCMCIYICTLNYGLHSVYTLLSFTPSSIKNNTKHRLKVFPISIFYGCDEH